MSYTPQTNLWFSPGFPQNGYRMEFDLQARVVIRFFSFSWVFPFFSQEFPVQLFHLLAHHHAPARWPDGQLNLLNKSAALASEMNFRALKAHPAEISEINPVLPSHGISRVDGFFQCVLLISRNLLWKMIHRWFSYYTYGVFFCGHAKLPGELQVKFGNQTHCSSFPDHWWSSVLYSHTPKNRKVNRHWHPMSGWWYQPLWKSRCLLLLNHFGL